MTGAHRRTRRRVSETVAAGSSVSLFMMPQSLTVVDIRFCFKNDGCREWDGAIHGEKTTVINSIRKPAEDDLTAVVSFETECCSSYLRRPLALKRRAQCMQSQLPHKWHLCRKRTTLGVSNQQRRRSDTVSGSPAGLSGKTDRCRRHEPKQDSSVLCRFHPLLFLSNFASA